MECTLVLRYLPMQEETHHKDSIIVIYIHNWIPTFQQDCEMYKIVRCTLIEAGNTRRVSHTLEKTTQNSANKCDLLTSKYYILHDHWATTGRCWQTNKIIHFWKFQLSALQYTIIYERAWATTYSIEAGLDTPRNSFSNKIPPNIRTYIDDGTTLWLGEATCRPTHSNMPGIPAVKSCLWLWYQEENNRQVEVMGEDPVVHSPWGRGRGVSKNGEEIK